MPQQSDNSISASIYALVSLGTWFTTITVQDMQVLVSIAGGLVAFASGVISIYKNLKSKK